MKVVIIGSGNAATVLGRRIAESGHPILQVFSRSREHAGRLASTLGCPFCTEWAEISRDGELYLVALSDHVLLSLAGRLSLPGKLVVHTAGAISRDVLMSVSENYGVLYPLQSLRATISSIPAIPLLVDARHPADQQRIMDFARTISGQVEAADDATRLKLHLASVVVNNFSNHLYVLAAEFCNREGIRFDLLLPLIRETAERLSFADPRKAQTGPAARGDEPTIEKHLRLLDNYKDIKELYQLFTVQIEQLNRDK